MRAGCILAASGVRTEEPDSLGSRIGTGIPNRGGKIMPAITGSFSGNVNVQAALAVSDQSNHELGVAEIHCTQKSSDEKWNKAQMTYWGVTDVVDGKGSQRGNFVNVQ